MRAALHCLVAPASWFLGNMLKCTASAVPPATRRVTVASTGKALSPVCLPWHGPNAKSMTQAVANEPAAARAIGSPTRGDWARCWGYLRPRAAATAIAQGRATRRRFGAPPWAIPKESRKNPSRSVHAFRAERLAGQPCQCLRFSYLVPADQDILRDRHAVLRRRLPGSIDVPRPATRTMPASRINFKHESRLLRE